VSLTVVCAGDRDIVPGLINMLPQLARDQAWQVEDVLYRVGGKNVQATIKPSGGDPFDKSIFRNLKAPQTMVKQ